jgi:hypothetical protein
MRRKILTAAFGALAATILTGMGGGGGGADANGSGSAPYFAPVPAGQRTTKSVPAPRAPAASVSAADKVCVGGDSNAKECRKLKR